MVYKVDREKCRACKMCLRARCPAIKITDKAEINKDKCSGCGVCLSLCLTGAIEELKRLQKKISSLFNSYYWHMSIIVYNEIINDICR